MRELEEEAQALAALAAGMGGGPMPSLSNQDGREASNQGGNQASTSGMGSSGGSQTRGQEEKAREQPHEHGFGIAVGETYNHPSPVMHLEPIARMGLAATSSAPFLPSQDSPPPILHRESIARLLSTRRTLISSPRSTEEVYNFDPGEQHDQDIPTGFISSKPEPSGGQPSSDS